MKFFCCATRILLLLSIFGTASATLDVYVRNGTGVVEKRTLFHQVLQVHKHFGVVPTNETFDVVQVLSEDDITLLCQSLDNNTILDTILVPKYKDTVMIVMLGSPLECNGRLRPSMFETLYNMCRLEAILILENELNLLPTETAHDGARFANAPFKNSCRFLFTPEPFTDELANEIPNGTYTARVSIDSNQFTIAFEQPLAQIVLRYLLGGMLLYVAGLSLHTFVVRLVGRTLNFVFTFVLLFNLITALFLGVLQIMGMWFIADNLEFSLSLAAFSQFFGTGVATEFLVSILYRDIVRRAFATRTCIDFTKSNCVFVTMAIVLTIADWMLFAIVCVGSMELNLLVFLRLIVGLFFFAAQIWIAVYLFIRVWKMILRINPKASSKTGNTNLERHFRRWIKVSLIAAFFSTLGLLAMALDFIFISPEMWLITLFANTMGKIFNLYSQTKLCAPVTKTNVYKVDATQNVTTPNANTADVPKSEASSSGYVSF